MVLEPYNTIKYILSKNILQLDFGVDCNIIAFDKHLDTDRNSVVFLEIQNRENKINIVLKQPKVLDNYGIRFINNERCFYEFIIGTSFYSIPKFIFFDEHLKIIIIEEIANKVTLNTLIKQEEHKKIKVLISETGLLLKKFHDSLKTHTLAETPFTVVFSPFSFLKTLIIELPRLEKFDYDNVNFSDFFDFLSNKGLLIKISKIVDKWNNSHIIHGDFHYKNILICENDISFTQLRIIDFELSGIGDPIWDLANYVYSILVNPVAEIKVIAPSQLNEFINTFIDSYDKDIDKSKLVEFVGIKALWDVWKNALSKDKEQKLEQVYKMIFDPSNYIFTFL